MLISIMVKYYFSMMKSDPLLKKYKWSHYFEKKHIQIWLTDLKSQYYDKMWEHNDYICLMHIVIDPHYSIWSVNN